MKRVLPFALAMIAAFAPGPGSAQSETGQERIRQVVVYGRDPCPRASNDEVVICARRPERDRYRIPEALRTTPPGPESESWAARAESLEYVGRTGIQSCSTVGPNGFTGCWEQMMRQARNDRRANPENRPDPR